MNHISAERPQELEDTARAIRATMLRMASAAGTGHIASGLSMVEILTVLYFRVMRLSDHGSAAVGPDRLILSKGHGALALYAALFHRGLISAQDIADYHRRDTRMTTFPSEPFLPGVLFASGSLGHGPGVGCGAALALKKDSMPGRIFAVLSDGECQEGSVWEAALFAGHHRLDNLVFIVDNNRFQAIGRTADIVDIEPLERKWEGFGFETRRVDGHDMRQLEESIGSPSSRPVCVLADTVKGKGVSFMENSVAWHYLPIEGALADQAFRDVGAGG